MTASAARRRTSTQTGAIATLVALILTVVVGSIAFVTLRTSNEGRAPETDPRTVVSYPKTPNAVVGIVDDLDRLTSLAVVTLHPSGSGGSILTIPVNADVNNGFGPDRRPISRQPYTPGDDAQAAELLAELEPLLTLTIERSVVLGPDELAELVEPFAPLAVNLPERIIDSDTPGSGFVAGAGERELDAETIVDAFTAISASGDSYSHHDVDVALWSALAFRASATGSDAELPRDEFDRPIPPESALELLDRLFAGDVGVRDVAIDREGAAAASNDDGDDFVLVDRADSLLVFGSISPSLVSKPNEALAFKLVVPYTEEQVAVLGDDAFGDPITKTSLTRRFIAELLFGQANIVAVDLTEAPEAVPEQTQLLVTDESLVEVVQATSDQFFGDADVEVAEVITEGTDVVVVLGENFLDLRLEQLEEERATAEPDDEDRDDDGEADFNLSDDEGPDVTDETDSTVDGPDVTADTVEADG